MQQLELDLRTDAQIASDKNKEDLLASMKRWKHRMGTDPVYRKEVQDKMQAEYTRIMKEQAEKDKQYQKNQREWWAKNKDRSFDI